MRNMQVFGFAQSETYSDETPEHGPSPSGRTGALLSKHVYGGKDAAEVGNTIGDEAYTVSDLNSQFGADDPATGFKGKLYEATIGGVKSYVLAYAGTENWVDAWQDVKQIPGSAAQYAEAVNLAKSVASTVGAENLTFVGHSLGGGLAQAGAVATDSRAMTYNPAWMSNNTISNLHLDVSKGQIHNYIIANDILNAGQTISGGYLGLHHLGRDHMFVDLKNLWNPVKAHGIDSFFDPLW